MMIKRLLLLLLIGSQAFSAPGQNFFVTSYDNTPQFYGGAEEGSSYAGFQIFENMNLLATVLGDDAHSLLDRGQTLAPRIQVIADRTRYSLQPFAGKTRRQNRQHDLPLGPALDSFLQNPLGTEKFDLTLPFTDSRIALTNRAAWLRLSEDEDTMEFHSAIDFDKTGDRLHPFDVIAPRDGIVHNGERKGTFVILHETPLGKEFLTVYQHLDPASKSSYRDGDSIRRGQRIGTTGPDNEGEHHLHFGVAVKGPAAVVDGKPMTPQWFFIDPMGVYDYRKARFSSTLYNYLPNNNIDSTVQGIRKAFVFITNPISGSFYYANEDCSTFNPNLLSIDKLPGGEYQLSAGRVNIEQFRNVQDAGKAMQIIRRNGFTRVCYTARPAPQFKYYK